VMNPAPARPEPARRRESARRHPRNNRIQHAKRIIVTQSVTSVGSVNVAECVMAPGSESAESGAAAGKRPGIEARPPDQLPPTEPTSYVYRIWIPVGFSDSRSVGHFRISRAGWMAILRGASNSLL